MIENQEQLKFYSFNLKRIKVYIKRLCSQKALGLVEVLIALAVVSTGMVMITSLSLKTLKVVRKNELQDIAVQLGVEAMDFMKQPGTIAVQSYDDTYAGYYYLDISSEPYKIVEVQGYEEIDTCDSNSRYRVSSVAETSVCQQIQVQNDPGGSSTKYNIKVILVWETVGRDEYDKKVYTGIRRGGFKNL